MNFVIHSTLVVATSLAIIGLWLLVGYVITRIWWHFLGEKIQYTKKTITGIISGPITLIYMAATAFMNLMPDHY